ncbi:MAG: 50S ribosomal L9 C-terminal domain-containing protein, partial [Pseudomonadota bacterium]|nr:50S ribosomal L9 C-terminal domain-containing protein [Pseudomonadota bacterium]
TQAGFTVERRQILLDTPIKMLGLHKVRVGLHPEVVSSVTVNVARSEDEAERQARGEDVTVPRSEAEQALADAEALFERAELADEAREQLSEGDGEKEAGDEAAPEAKSE